MDAEWIFSLVVEKFQTFLVDEAIISQPKLRSQVQKVTNKLLLIQQSLKTARRRIDQQMATKLLGALYSAEDATDTFLTRTFPQPLHTNSTDEKCQFFVTRLWSQVVFAFKIQKFMAQIQVHGFECDNSVSAGLSLGNDATTQLQSRGIISANSYSFDEKKDVVGLENQIMELVGRLIPEHESSQPATEVIAVVGEVGSGKTTLAKIVYDRVNVKQYFKNRVCINVSNYELKARDVMFEMLKQVDELVAQAEEPLLEQDLMSRVSELLSHSARFLIVLDDVRSPRVWERLRYVFPNSDNGSKIVITTSSEDVATVVASSSATIQIGRLNNEDSWKLFLKKVHITEDNSKFKEQILKLCGGLPLAITLMGGLLSVKDSSDDEWLRMIEVASNVSGDVVALSYQELSAQIKPCFLYMGLFPKAFEVPVRRLFQLWIAEGLVRPSSCLGELEPEDVAAIYLEELINRNMIEVTRWRSDGIPKMCYMPGSIYDIFSPKAADLGLFFVHSKSQYTSKDEAPFPVRRLASYFGLTNYPPSNHYIQHLRSLLSFTTHKGGMPAGEIGKFLNKIISSKLGLLTVLDLEGVYKPRLPDGLGKLIYLKYLGLRSTALITIPSSVCVLPCLETLDIKYTMITRLPSSIWMRKHLRHLYMDWIHFDDISTQLPFDSSEHLAKLQTLWGLYLTEPVLNMLDKITSLRKLGLRFSFTSQEALNNWILQLSNLQSLRLRSVKTSGDRGTLRLCSMAEHHKLLDLYLLGVLPRPIDVKRLPPNLKILTLSMSQLRIDPMQRLGWLPHLNILKLFADSYLGQEMKCYRGGFPQLHVLKMWKLEELKEWTVEDGAMPCLRELEIRACKRFQRIDGLRYVTSMKELKLTNMSSEFEKNVKECIGTDVLIKENHWKPCPLLA